MEICQEKDHSDDLRNEASDFVVSFLLKDVSFSLFS